MLIPGRTPSSKQPLIFVFTLSSLVNSHIIRTRQRIFNPCNRNRHRLHRTVTETAALGRPHLIHILVGPEDQCSVPICVILFPNFFFFRIFAVPWFLYFSPLLPCCWAAISLPFFVFHPVVAAMALSFFSGGGSASHAKYFDIR